MIRRSIFTMIAAIVAAAGAGSASAQSGVDPAAKHAWSEGAGWLNWRDADGSAAGARIVGGRIIGFVWSERAGWINLGDADATAGVNIGPGGALAGSAWSERAGWVNFSTAQSLGADGARLAGGRLRGFAWSEGAGWINLDSHEPGAFVALACRADITGDGVVGGEDLLALLNGWGGAGAGDLNNDGETDGVDLLILLSAWGPC